MMPIYSAAVGARHAANYIADTPVIIVYMLILWYLGQHEMKENVPLALRRIPVILIVIYLFLIYAATEAPAIYASNNLEGISGAYYDTVYHVFLLTLTIAIPIVAARVPKRLRINGRVLLVAGLIVSGLGIKPSVKQSAAYICYDFVRSGHFEDYCIQMEERIALLTDDDLKDVYVPEMSDQQGPFFVLQLSQDKTNYTNIATARFYQKNSVMAVPRDQYYAEYAAEQGHDIPEDYRGLYR